MVRGGQEWSGVCDVDPKWSGGVRSGQERSGEGRRGREWSGAVRRGQEGSGGGRGQGSRKKFKFKREGKTLRPKILKKKTNTRKSDTLQFVLPTPQRHAR